MALPNFYKVSDTLSRGAQPDRDGFALLKTMGIKTIINLRWLHTDKFHIYGMGFNYEHIRCKAWHPEKEDADIFLSIVGTACMENKTPVFVHCQHGADRTGVMVAIYRIRFQGWTVKDATEEMVHGPYGFHEIWECILPPFLEKIKI